LFLLLALAGSIIPAIATTNAIVAGLIVLEALKALSNKSNECKAIYLRDKPSNNKIISSFESFKPNEKCYVCANKPEIIVKLNTDTFTIKQFETKVFNFFYYYIFINLKYNLYNKSDSKKRTQHDST